MAITIANFIGVADTFTFPHNPKVFDVAQSNNIEVKVFAHINFSTVISTGGVLPKNLVLSGFFDGSSKRTNLRDFTKHVQQSHKLKKLVFESGKFHLVYGRRIKEVNVGGRTNFIDYVAGFSAITAKVFSTTLDTHTDGGAEQTNDGGDDTFVFELAGTYDGTGDVVLTDSLGTTITVDSGAFSATEKFIYRFVQNVPSGAKNMTYVTEYGYAGVSVDSGTTSSASDFKLIESGQNFSSTVNIGDLVVNTTDGTSTVVIGVDSNTQLSLRDNIMASSEAHVIYAQTRKVKTTTGTGVLMLGAGQTTVDVAATNLSAGYTIAIRDAWRA